MNGQLGGLDDVQEVKEQSNNVVPEERFEKKRKAFHFWEVNGNSYKLKLQTSMISKLENKYRRNLLNIVSDDGIPPLTVMLTIVQAALTPWEHGISYQKVLELYDVWVEKDGGSQATMLSHVIIPTMAVSGFFTPVQADSIVKSLEDSMELI